MSGYCFYSWKRTKLDDWHCHNMLTHAPQDLDRPVADFRGFSATVREVVWPKWDGFLFWYQICRHVRSERKTFLNLPPTSERVQIEKQKVEHLYCSPLPSSWKIVQILPAKKERHKKRESANLRRCQNCNRKWSWIRIRIFGLIRIQMSVRSVLKCGCIILLSPLVSVISPSMVQIDWLYEKC